MIIVGDVCRVHIGLKHCMQENNVRPRSNIRMISYVDVESACLCVNTLVLQNYRGKGVWGHASTCEVI